MNADNDEELLRLARQGRADFLDEKLKCRMPITEERAKQIIEQRTKQRLEQDQEEMEIASLLDALSAVVGEDDALAHSAIDGLKRLVESNDQKIRAENRQYLRRLLEV